MSIDQDDPSTPVDISDSSETAAISEMTGITGVDDVAITVAGQPASMPLSDVDAVASQLVGHFADNVAPCGTLPGEQLHGDVTTVTQNCLRMAIELLDQRTPPGDAQLAQLREAATQWAREGIPLDTVIHTYHEGIRIGFDLIAAQAGSGDLDALVSGFRLVMSMLDTFTGTVSTAYVEEQRVVAGHHQSATQALMSALLSGHTAASMARQTGLPVAHSYQVVALSIAPHHDEIDPHVNTKIAARRKLRRVQSALVTMFDNRALALLSSHGGTVLIPADPEMPRLTRERLEELTEVAGAAVVATHAVGPTDAVPDLAEKTHELMDLVRALRRPGGLYEMSDLLIEYQITRPGPARDHLAATLSPLANHPELLETLRVHLETGLNRKGTGRRMHIHPNTVDYRLRRISQTTGVDLTLPEGISRAHIALLALDLEEKAAGPSA